MTEIQERLNVPEEDVMRLTHSLSCAKYKILNKSPASRTVAKTDVFSMNKKFTDKMRRIRVSLSCSKLTTPAVAQPSHAGFVLYNTNILATAICVFVDLLHGLAILQRPAYSAFFQLFCVTGLTVATCYTDTSTSHR